MRPTPETPRLPDWPERLAAFLEERLGLPFAWGERDCVLTAADAVLAITGRDPVPDLRGTYATEAEAEALLQQHGGLEAAAVAAMAAFGAPECPTAYAQRGDVALVIQGNMPTMGVVTGSDVAAPGPDGLAYVPLAAAVRVWAV